VTKKPSLYAIFKEFGKQETFICDGCKCVIPKAWSDEEAIDEMHAQFPGFESSDCVVLCDECYEQFRLG
jgi:hypothetical protein